MFDNPFSPIFGGKPGAFFGREDVLGKFRNGLEVGGSHYKTLFLTGSRGTGKTTLLEKVSEMARDAGFITVDASYSSALDKLLRALLVHDEVTVTDDPQIGLQIAGSGVSVKGGGVSATDRFGLSDLDEFMISACEENGRGLLLTIDEVQKVKRSELEALCNAYQLASRKGANLLLVMAGLPGSYEKVTQYKGCTYIRRSVHVPIGLFGFDDAFDALSRAINSIDLLSITDEVAAFAARLSKGQPYLMQLLGFHLVEYLNAHVASARHEIGRETHEVSQGDLRKAFDSALLDYKQGALKPLVDELPYSEYRYLKAVAESLDAQRIASVSAIRSLLGDDASRLSTPRQRLIAREILVSAGYGKLAFAIPYLADYLTEGVQESALTETALAWKL